MDTVDLLLLLLVCCVLAAVRQLRLFPARLDEWWDYAFGARHRDERSRLRDVRSKKRDVADEHEKARNAVKKRNADSISNSRNRAQTVERERKKLLKLPPGEQMGPDMGELRLHAYSLSHLEEAADGEEPSAERNSIPLPGLHARTKFTGETVFIKLTKPDGYEDTAAYPRNRYDEAEVERFTDRINNQAKKAAEVSRSRERQAAELAEQKEQIDADMQAAEQANRRELDKLLEAQRADPRRLQADDAWDKARERWKDKTGRRPPLWWWRPW